MGGAEQPPVSVPPAPRHPLNLARIQVMISRVIVGFGAIFGMLNLPALIDEQPRLHQPLGAVLITALCLCLAGAVAAATALRGVGPATAAFAVLYLIVTALWPLTIADATVDGTQWLWTLCTVAIAYAAVGMNPWLAGAYAGVAPLTFCLVVCWVSDGRDWVTAVLDGVYAAIVGCVVLIIATLLRSAAAGVDRAQRSALEGYERGLREHLGEAERVEVDAIVHDSVLTTLIAAAKARTPESKALAVHMAQDALGHLSSSQPAPSPHPSPVADAAGLVAGIRSSAADLSHHVEVRARLPGSSLLPPGAIEALHAATVQAMVNSTQHAGGDEVTRTVTIRGADAGSEDGVDGVRIEIADDGAGFDVQRVAPRRLGLATSIIQRVEVVGGAALVDSLPGAGTRITLSWPAPDQREDPR